MLKAVLQNIAAETLVSMAKALRKTERFNLRASEQEKLVIEQAAQIQRTTASDFMLAAAYTKALEVIESVQHIQLNQGAWERFCAALDRSAKDLPRLKELMSAPSVFDQD